MTDSPFRKTFHLIDERRDRIDCSSRGPDKEEEGKEALLFRHPLFRRRRRGEERPLRLLGPPQSPRLHLAATCGRNPARARPGCLGSLSR